MRHSTIFVKVTIAFLFTFSMIFLYRCSESVGDAYSNSGTGIGGSLNRFTIADSFLYVINNDHVETFIIDEGLMTFQGATKIDESIETVFPFDTLVFVGGQFGMYICKRTDNGVLELASRYEHIESCDPVVTDGTYAYVTLSSGCRNQADQLEILDVTDIYNPILLETYPMENPKGLGVDGNLLFICDTSAGLKIYDRTDPVNISLAFHFTHLYPVDVIAFKGLLFVMTDVAIHLFDYRDETDIHEISTTLLQ